MPAIGRTAVEATKLYPVINSSISDDLKEITYHGSVNLGIAVDTPRGLIVPVIKEADERARSVVPGPRVDAPAVRALHRTRGSATVLALLLVSVLAAAVVAAIALGAGPSLLVLIEAVGRAVATWAADVFRSVVG